jgi:hypothetical protein
MFWKWFIHIYGVSQLRGIRAPAHKTKGQPTPGKAARCEGVARISAATTAESKKQLHNRLAIAPIFTRHFQL